MRRPSSVLTQIGPGLLVAAAGIGAGDIVSSTVAASRHGLALLWRCGRSRSVPH